MESIPLYFKPRRPARSKFIDGAGGAAEGVARCRWRRWSSPTSCPTAIPQKPLRASPYTKAYRDAYKEAISTFGGHAYDALMIARRGR